MSHSDTDSDSHVQNYQIKSPVFFALIYNLRISSSITNVVFQSLGMFSSQNVRGIARFFSKEGIKI